MVSLKIITLFFAHQTMKRQVNTVAHLAAKASSFSLELMETGAKLKESE